MHLTNREKELIAGALMGSAINASKLLDSTIYQLPKNSVQGVINEWLELAEDKFGVTMAVTPDTVMTNYSYPLPLDPGDVSEYKQLALRSDLSDEQYEEVNKRIDNNFRLIHKLGSYIDLLEAYSNAIDEIKKALFYGKSPTPQNCTELSPPTPFDRKRLEIIHGLIGLFSEVGELVPILKQALSDPTEIDKVNAAEEIGDVCWYLLGVLCEGLEIDPYDVLSANIEKLKARYPDKFSFNLANERNLLNERETLEKKLGENQND